MKQIKTIQYRADNLNDFDNEVNAALKEGWTLVRRAVLPPCDCGSVYFHRMVHAELEREIITEKERCCENCAWQNIPPEKEPCCCCKDGELWEETEE